MRIFSKQRWSPYVAGAIAGAVLCLSVLIAGKFVGASTTFVRSAGLIERTVASEHVKESPYFTKTKIKVDWQMMFVVGLILGSLVSSVISKDFKLTPIPPMWEKRFGTAKGQRFVVAFIGGIMALFGARLAGGWPSGHGLSGLAQMSISGYVALICFFGAGIITARILYGKGE